MLNTFVKDPGAKLDYSIDWGEWMPDGDALASATWTPTGVTVASSPAPSFSGNVATVWLEGGTDGDDATVTCRITTTGGRIDERTIGIRLRER